MKNRKKKIIIVIIIILLVILFTTVAILSKIYSNRKITNNKITEKESVEDSNTIDLNNTNITNELLSSEISIENNVLLDNENEVKENSTDKNTVEKTETSKESSTSDSTSKTEKKSSNKATSKSSSKKTSTKPKEEEPKEEKHEPYSISRKVRNTTMESTIINAINSEIKTVTAEELKAYNEKFNINETLGKAIASKKAITNGDDTHYFTFRNESQIKNMIHQGDIIDWATTTYYVYCVDVYMWDSSGKEETLWHTNCYVYRVDIGHNF